MAWNEPGDGKGKDNGKDKDPWKDEQGPQPPDLDEALKKLQRNLKLLLSGKQGKGSDRNGAPSRGRTSGSFILFLVAAIVLWLLSGIFIVDPAEKAVVLRFGKYVTTLGPGPHWIPRFIYSKQVVDVERVNSFSYEALMLTRDQNIVSVSLAVWYRVNNPRDYLFNVVNPIESLRQATASTLRQVIGHSDLDAILTFGRSQIRDDVSTLLTKVFSAYQTGIEITQVALQPARAPEEVKGAFDDAIKAQEDEERFKNQAKAYEAGIVPLAEGRAKRLIQEADAYKQQQVLQAQGATARYLALVPEYKAYPFVTRERMYLDALGKILAQSQKIVVDMPGGQNIFYLPLDKILQNNEKQKTGSNVEEEAPAKNAERNILPIVSGRDLDRSSSRRLDRDSYFRREFN